MITQTFKKRLIKAVEKIEDSDGQCFVTDTIDMKELRKGARKLGFDDVLLVCGKGEDETFLLSIQKIKYDSH